MYASVKLFVYKNLMSDWSLHHLMTHLQL